jgi:hypothetical protein
VPVRGREGAPAQRALRPRTDKDAVRRATPRANIKEKRRHVPLIKQAQIPQRNQSPAHPPNPFPNPPANHNSISQVRAGQVKTAEVGRIV